MKNDKILNAFNNIQPSDEVKKRVLNKALQKQHKTRPVFRTAVSFGALAAVICLMVLGSMLLAPQGDSSFSIKAYAMEQLTDGSIEWREVDLLDQTHNWSSHYNGSEFYLNIRLNCEGENIKSADFYTDDGFFAIQYLKIENGKTILEKGVPAGGTTNSDGVDIITNYGLDYERIGNKYTLDNGKMRDDLLLFLGKEVQVTDWDNLHEQLPSQMTIRAVVTFNDGKTQEQTLILNHTSRQGLTRFEYPPEVLERKQEEAAKYQELVLNIPLDRCEVIETQTLTYGDTFEYTTSTTDGLISTHFCPITEESMTSFADLFNENGIFRQSSNLPNDGSDGYIAVIEHNGDGAFSGMVYKVPGQLILEYMK